MIFFKPKNLQRFEWELYRYETGISSPTLRWKQASHYSGKVELGGNFCLLSRLCIKIAGSYMVPEKWKNVLCSQLHSYSLRCRNENAPIYKQEPLWQHMKHERWAILQGSQGVNSQLSILWHPCTPLPHQRLWHFPGCCMSSCHLWDLLQHQPPTPAPALGW